MIDRTDSGGGRATRLAWGAFQRTKEFLARLGFKKIPGADRVYVLLKRNLRPPGTVLIESHGNRMYLDARDEGVLPLLQAGDVYEEYETGLFMELLKPGMTVVDIGANVGHYSLIAARMVGDSGRVFSFEPDPHNFDLLSRNIELNGFTNVTALNMAVSEKKGSLTLHLDKYNLGGHSLSAGNVLIDDGTVDVDTVSLDEYFENEAGEWVDVIKMDTQGAEGLIVEGAWRVLKDADPVLLMELWPYGLRNAGYDPATLVANLERLGFSFKVISDNDEEAKAMDSADVIELCADMKCVDEHVDLFLRKTRFE